MPHIDRSTVWSLRFFSWIIEQSINGKGMTIGGENPLIQGKVVFIAKQQVKILNGKRFNYL